MYFDDFRRFRSRDSDSLRSRQLYRDISLSFAFRSIGTLQRASGTHSHWIMVRFNWFYHFALLYFILYLFLHIYSPLLFRFYSFCFLLIRTTSRCSTELFYIYFNLFPTLWLPTIVPIHAKSYSALLFRLFRIFTCFSFVLVLSSQYLFQTHSRHFIFLLPHGTPILSYHFNITVSIISSIFPLLSYPFTLCSCSWYLSIRKYYIYLFSIGKQQ
jgi:hypothetical protein